MKFNPSLLDQQLVLLFWGNLSEFGRFYIQVIANLRGAAAYLSDGSARTAKRQDPKLSKRGTTVWSNRENRDLTGSNRMPITSIQNVINNRDGEIMFINTEYSGNNREIPSHNTRAVGNCWIPWCTRESDFPGHHLEIIDVNSGNILWYIWQQSRNDGDFVRASRTGFNDPTSVGGSAGVGRSNNLFISAEEILAVDA